MDWYISDLSPDKAVRATGSSQFCPIVDKSCDFSYVSPTELFDWLAMSSKQQCCIGGTKHNVVHFLTWRKRIQKNKKIMSIPSELPKKCQECAKSAGPILNRKCNFCRDLEFCESVLCDLNRHVQNPFDLRCHAFQPILKLAIPSGTKRPDLSGGLEGRSRREPFLKLLRSDKIKYKKALALQKLDRDPDSVLADIKYHIVWSVIDRRPVFSPSNYYFDFVHDSLLKCNELVGGFTTLLWLAPDHIHVYVESDGEKSVESIVEKLKKFLNNAIIGKFPDVSKKIDAKIEIWDEAYFVESVG